MDRWEPPACTSKVDKNDWWHCKYRDKCHHKSLPTSKKCDRSGLLQHSSSATIVWTYPKTTHAVQYDNTILRKEWATFNLSQPSIARIYRLGVEYSDSQPQRWAQMSSTRVTQSFYPPGLWNSSATASELFQSPIGLRNVSLEENSSRFLSSVANIIQRHLMTTNVSNYCTLKFHKKFLQNELNVMEGPCSVTSACRFILFWNRKPRSDFRVRLLSAQKESIDATLQHLINEARKLITCTRVELTFKRP